MPLRQSAEVCIHCIHHIIAFGEKLLAFGYLNNTVSVYVFTEHTDAERHYCSELRCSVASRDIIAFRHDDTAAHQLTISKSAIQMR